MAKPTVNGMDICMLPFLRGLTAVTVKRGWVHDAGRGSEELERVIQFDTLCQAPCLGAACRQPGTAQHLTFKEINYLSVVNHLSVNYQNVPLVGRLIIKVTPSCGIMQPLIWMLGLTHGGWGEIQP